MVHPAVTHRSNTQGIYRISRLFKRFCWCAVFLLSACSSSTPSKGQSYQSEVTEKELNELQDKMDEVYHRVSVMQLMVDNHERTLRGMERKLGYSNSSQAGETGVLSSASGEAGGSTVEEENISAGQSLSARTSAASPTASYNKALADYQRNEFTSAAAEFDSFLKQYPRHELADNALYWRGECSYAKKNFAEAIRVFQQVINRFPNGSKVPDAMLKAGYAYLSVGDKQNGKRFLNQLVQKYPFSPAGGIAEKKLQQIR